MIPHLIQWLAFLLCLLCALLRLPEALRGRGRMVFSAFVLLSLAVGLTLPVVYLPVDGFLGGGNVANLVMWIAFAAAFMLLGLRTAVAFGSAPAGWLIGGPVGISVFVIAVGLTAYFFAIADVPISSPGLDAYGTDPEVRWYKEAGRSYPAFVAACLLGPSLRMAGDWAMRPMHRIAATLVGAGFLLVLLHTVLRSLADSASVTPWAVLTALGAVVLMASGLALIWLCRRRQARTPRPNPLR